MGELIPLPLFRCPCRRDEGKRQSWTDQLCQALDHTVGWTWYEATPAVKVSLRDHCWLQTLKRCLVIFGLFAYVAKQLLDKKYLEVSSVQGVARIQLQHPVENHCNPLDKHCKEHYRPISDMPYCEQKGDQQKSLVGSQLPCLYEDEFDMIRGDPQQRDILVTTRHAYIHQKRDCNEDTGVCGYMVNTTKNVFVADAENYTILIDHAFVAHEIEIERNSWNMVGFYSPCLGKDKEEEENEANRGAEEGEEDEEEEGETRERKLEETKGSPGIAPQDEKYLQIADSCDSSENQLMRIPFATSHIQKECAKTGISRQVFDTTVTMWTRGYWANLFPFLPWVNPPYSHPYFSVEGALPMLSKYHSAVMTIDQAKTYCSEGMACDGFSYKGSHDITGKVRINFHKKSRPVTPVDGETWTTYLKEESGFVKIRQGDVIHIGTILRRLGIDLDKPIYRDSSGKTTSLRHEGVVLLLQIKYTNYKIWTWPNKLPTVYTYHFKHVGVREYKAMKSKVQISHHADTRTIDDRHGIYIMIQQEGRLGEFSLRELLLVFVESLALYGLVKWLLTCMALNLHYGEAGDSFESTLIIDHNISARTGSYFQVPTDQTKDSKAS